MDSLALSPIKDPIHDYLQFNVFEHEIIDSPYFQRLHFILQNSTNYVSFPANKNSRFIHSLGVAKLSGDLFVQGLNSADGKDLIAFLVACKDLLQKGSIKLRTGDGTWQRVEQVWRKHIGNAAGFDHRPSSGTSLSTKELDEALAADGDEISAAFIVNTFWTAMRIGGLVHDIGHLPMSHSFEVGLERASELLKDASEIAFNAFDQHMSAAKSQFHDPRIKHNHEFFVDDIANVTGLPGKHISHYITSSLPIHEIRGLMTVDIMLRNPTGGWDDDEREYRNLIYFLVQIVLFASSSKLLEGAIETLSGTSAWLLLSLKRIIAGEVDSDRLDYTVRDGKATGSSVGSFDLPRVLSSSVLLQPEPNKFVFGFEERGISGLEQFFQQRYEGYKYLIFHRTAARSEAALHELIAKLFSVSYQHPDSETAVLLERFGYLSRKVLKTASIESLLPNERENIVRLDDANLRTLLFELNLKLSESSCADRANFDAFDLEQIETLLKVVLFRDFRHVYNPLRGSWVHDFLKSEAETLGASNMDPFSAVAREFLTDATGEEAILKVRKEAKENGCGLLYSLAKPKIYAETPTNAVTIRTSKDRSLRSLGEVSPQLRNLSGKQGEDAAFRLCFAAQNIKSNNALMLECDKIVKDFLVDLLITAEARHEKQTKKGL